MKKLFIYICTILMVCSLFAGCGAESTNGYVEVENERFKTVYNKDHERIIVDTETGVMYLCRYAGYGAGMTVMVDENGAPLIWEGE